MALKLLFLNEKSNTTFSSILLPTGPFPVLKISTSHHITLTYVWVDKSSRSEMRDFARSSWFNRIMKKPHM